MKKEEFRRISSYMDRLKAAESSGIVLTEAEKLDLTDLLKQWIAELEEKPTTVRIPSSWGDVRKKDEVQ